MDELTPRRYLFKRMRGYRARSAILGFQILCSIDTFRQ